MAPNLFGTSATLFLEASQQNVHQGKSTAEKESNQTSSVQKSSSSKPKYQWQIVWRNVFAFLYVHTAAVYGFYLLFNGTRFYTFAWSMAIMVISALGITAGAHRLWAHRAYKARWPLRFFLMICQTIAFQNHIYEWVRDHRVHHKFTDTDADPHNAKRGFFFSHMGWLLVRKHPDVMNKGKTVDMSDLENDPIVVWQKRLYLLLMPLCTFIIPMWVPCYFWNEKPLNSWYVTMMRYAISLNFTWLVNSAAHIWGMKPYDKSISPVENKWVAILTAGEGWHNYHHVFPWDYKAGELGFYKMNWTTLFLDTCARFGLAYDMKTVPTDVIKKRSGRTGDGTWDHHNIEEARWGWGDKDMKADEVNEVEIINKIE
ncbi:acyl-CoA Delta(11) desaturase-like [Ceratina calcarata]|uniref:Acyl-CoA Delta(11) desaturase-like n=2 Tax=Ceratina calcarata TaxID=156304 RepID=A0AAJ7WFM3_9HYME|nr:acyl-CoA Delta(11) desaturase-like [Ceratina calcarata]